MSGSRVAYYLVLAVFTAAAFGAGWVMRGRTASRDGDSSTVIGEAAAASWALEVLATRDAEAARRLAVKRLTLAVDNVREAAERGARVDAPLDRQDVANTLRRAASWGQQNADPKLKDAAEAARKALTD